MKEVKKKLVEEFCEDADGLRDLELGSEQYRSSVDGITKIADRLIRIEEVEIDREMRARQLEADNAIKSRQLRDERKDRVIKNSIGIGTFIVTTALSVWGINKTFKFDATDTVTSTLGRKILNDLIPRR